MVTSPTGRHYEPGIWWKGMPETNYNHPAYGLTSDLKLLEEWREGRGPGSIRRDWQPFDSTIYRAEKALASAELAWVRGVGV